MLHVQLQICEKKLNNLSRDKSSVTFLALESIIAHVLSGLAYYGIGYICISLCKKTCWNISNYSRCFAWCIQLPEMTSFNYVDQYQLWSVHNHLVLSLDSCWAYSSKYCVSDHLLMLYFVPHSGQEVDSDH